MSATDVPEGVALARAGWRYRRMVRILQDVKDVEQLREAEHAEVDARYEKYLDDKRTEYRQLRGAFAELHDLVANGVCCRTRSSWRGSGWRRSRRPPTHRKAPSRESNL